MFVFFQLYLSVYTLAGFQPTSGAISEVVIFAFIGVQLRLAKRHSPNSDIDS